MINPSVVVTKWAGGWPCLIVDNFFEPSFLRSALAQMKIGEYQRVADDQFGVQFQALGSAALARSLMSSEFRSFLKTHTGQDWRFDRTSWIQLRKTTSASVPLPRHTDQLPGQQAVALFYLNQAWTPENGGELCLHSSNESSEADACLIAPLMNRLVFFESNHLTWHSVRPVIKGERLNVGWEMTRRPQ